MMQKWMIKSPVLIPYIGTVIGLWMLENAWAAMLIYHVLAVVLVRKEWRQTIQRGKRLGVMGKLAVATALCGGPALFILWPYIAVAPDQLPNQMAHFGLSGWSLWLFVAWFCIIHPVIEESLWRRMDPDPWQFVSLQDLFFAGYHGLVVCWFVTPIWVVLSLVTLWSASIFWRWITWKTQSRFTAFVSHAVADASIIIGIAIMTSR
jgi:hypothetical protein